MALQLKLHRYRLKLHHPFRTAHGVREAVNTLIVELSDGEHHGFGEAPEIEYYPTNTEDHIAALESARNDIESDPLDDPALMWQRLQPQLGAVLFAQCALDQAAYDLFGKQQGRPTYELWNLQTTQNVPSNYTIGLSSIDDMKAKLDEYASFPVYKIKLGSKEGIAHDLKIIESLRGHTDAAFRVDANTGWSAEDTIMASKELAAMGVEFIEQPMPKEQLEAMEQVFEQSALPVIADETCIHESDVAKCAHRFHGINIKLTKCGGLTPARRMVAEAKSLNMKVMAGCMTESTVGISALGQLLPMLDYVDMDGAILLGEDVADGVKVVDGVAVYPDSVNGNGVTLTREV